MGKSFRSKTQRYKLVSCKQAIKKPLNPFSLPEDKEEVLAGLQTIDPSIEVSQVKMWCNDAFYRYLSGESHQ